MRVPITKSVSDAYNVYVHFNHQIWNASHHNQKAKVSTHHIERRCCRYCQSWLKLYINCWRLYLYLCLGKSKCEQFEVVFLFWFMTCFYRWVSNCLALLLFGDLVSCGVSTSLCDGVCGFLFHKAFRRRTRRWLYEEKHGNPDTIDFLRTSELEQETANRETRRKGGVWLTTQNPSMKWTTSTCNMRTLYAPNFLLLVAAKEV